MFRCNSTTSVIALISAFTLSSIANAKDSFYASALGSLTFKNISTQKSNTGTTNKYIL